jgi:hypothetical protein
MMERQSMTRKSVTKKGILMLLSIIFILATMPGMALAMTSCDIVDTVSGSSYQLISMSDSSNTAQDFSYTVPDSGVTVLMFFSTGCGNSSKSFTGFAQSDWISDSKVNVVAVESHGATKAATQAFMQEYAYGNQSFHTYYGNRNLQIAYAKLIFNSTSVTWPFVLVIDNEEGSNHIRYCSMGALGADELGNAISAVLDGDFDDNSDDDNNGGSSNNNNNGGSSEIEDFFDSDSTVNVTVAGVQNYDCANEIVESVNQNRAENGLSALTMNATLTEAAMQRAAEIAVYYDHVRPNDSDCITVVSGKYSGYSKAGENINYDYGDADAASTMEDWMNSPGHRENILTSVYTQIGVGVFTTNNMTWYVQMFGNSKTNTTTISKTGSKTANVTVETLPVHLSMKLLSASSAKTLSKNASGTYYLGTKTDNANDDVYTALVPIVSNVKDSSNSSLTIANASVKNDGTGGVVLNAVAAGSGKVTLKAYEGETNPQTFTLTVTDGNSNNAANNSAAGSTTTTHTAASAWSSNANSHWHACTVSGHTDKLDTASHSAKTVAAVAATCSKTGLSAGSVCSVCGRTLVAQTTTAKTSHSYGSWTTTKAATATSTGTKVRTCSVCGNKETATIAATGTTTTTTTSGNSSSVSATTNTTQNTTSTSTSSKDTTTNMTTGSGAVKNFKDVRSGAWYESAVKYAQDKGLMNGETETSFGPNNSMTRAMLMTVLARLDGQDTSGGATWYEKAMNWAVEKDISDGTNADGEISREQLATMLYRYVGSPDVDGTLASFTDSSKVHSFAQDALAWAVEKGLVKGNADGSLNPGGNATRAEVATILMRFCENFDK